MIEHYALYGIDKLTDRFGLTDGVPKGVKPRYNVVPTNRAAVIIKHGESTELAMMRWGLVSAGAKDSNSVFRYKTYFVESEKVFSKQTWDTAVHTQRCIVPVNGFYMIRRDDPKDAYYFSLADGSLMAIGGIYTLGSDPEDQSQRTFSVLTIESNDVMPLPFGRMPLLLQGDNESKWIDPSLTDMSSIVQGMRPYDAAKLAYRKVSGDIKSLKLDSPHLIESL